MSKKANLKCIMMFVIIVLTFQLGPEGKIKSKQI